MKRVCVILFLVTTACAKTSATGASPEASATPSATPTVAADCPKDLLAASGTPCSSPGKICGADPKGFTHFMMCNSGKWTEMNAPPPPPPPPPH